MFQKFNVSNNNRFDKSNIKFLKIISIILAILIIVCLILFVLGVVKKFSKLSSKKDNNISVVKYEEFDFFYPEDAQFISAALGSEGKILLRYQLRGENILLIIDTVTKTIINKIFLTPGKKWDIK
tara:strand:- start:1081 stop:1455 length:375 start_codon:yes stop_codon:yes gene_type:complete